MYLFFVLDIFEIWFEWLLLLWFENFSKNWNLILMTYFSVDALNQCYLMLSRVIPISLSEKLKSFYALADGVIVSQFYCNQLGSNLASFVFVYFFLVRIYVSCFYTIIQHFPPNVTILGLHIFASSFINIFIINWCTYQAKKIGVHIYMYIYIFFLKKYSAHFIIYSFFIQKVIYLFINYIF